ncbi:amidohydrolase [Kordiimonas marina]|uniref:amidohydrolase n=1 Tax=Kordiimonas marina TaxID=2872312 RepID=UPI001FF4DF4F|nr:amidohydrolase [Kordiimonas marina]
MKEGAYGIGEVPGIKYGKLGAWEDDVKYGKASLYVAAGFLSLWGGAGAHAQSADISGGLNDGHRDAPADLILTNAQVKTPDGWVQALAVRHGTIIALGDNTAALHFKGANTTLLDLHGETVLPGLHDMHVHPLFAGMEKLFSCALPPGADAKAVRARVSACAAGKKPGQWISGGNWVAGAFKAGEQTKALLDEAAPDNPVILTDEAHHSIWVNSKALEAAGVTAETKAPMGGIIEKDAAGQPTGLFRETAVDLVATHMPTATLQEKRQALLYSAHKMLSYGITSFIVASVRYGNIDALAELADEGLLKQRVRGCIVWNPAPEVALKATEALITDRAYYTRGRFHPDCVKIFMDGVPTESHTAAMLAPYAHGHGAKGALLPPVAQLNEAVARFDREGLQVKFHAAGDGAVRAAIDAVAYARAKNGFGGPMHDVAHNSFVDPADIPRVRGLGMAWEFSPYIWYPTPITADVEKAVGPARMKRFIPIREAVTTGANVVMGSDWSVVPSVNPWLAIETMVTRQVPGGGAALNREETVSFDEAMKIATLDGARLMGDSDKVGQLSLGMKADMIVTEQNPYKVKITDLHTTKVLMTFIDGEKVFDRSAE